MDEDGGGVAAVLDRGLEDAQRRTGLTVAFTGLVHPDRRQFVISALRGTWTNSLSNLAVRSGEGLGGKALALSRPATVANYRDARGITRRYDYAVAPERLRSIVSLPVALPGQAPLAMLYLAERHEVGFDGRLYDRLGPALLTMAQDLRIELEVARRVQAARAAALAEREPTAGRSAGADLVADIASVMARTTDAATQQELRRILAGLADPRASTDSPPASPLTRRETAVLRSAETGCSNAEIADALGLVESTVKSYMKSAMAKLGADNRVRACRTARRAGYLD
ncbi:LuxR C-terminal-related transcriptional regulator [Nocardioides alkalitolerans]|uniref:LuxR C-terminal-related transcriptional regulator n=1 Tax=Nocardioides alkalitolerans TaxID=281714 RepID=UPI0004039FFC|nr:LuxR C-terminal-related transcriptional regulator [Nocardioides alkalitolerans]